MVFIDSFDGVIFKNECSYNCKSVNVGQSSGQAQTPIGKPCN